MTATTVHIGSRTPISADTVCESCGTPVSLLDLSRSVMLACVLGSLQGEAGGTREWCEVHTGDQQNGFYEAVVRAHTPDLCRSARDGTAKPVPWTADG